MLKRWLKTASKATGNKNGKLNQALAALAQARALTARLYGPTNSSVGDVDFYTAEAEAAAGHPDAALARVDRVKVIYDASYGPNDPDQAELLALRARILAGAGRPEAAAQQCDLAIALRVRLAPEDAASRSRRDSCNQAGGGWIVKSFGKVLLLNAVVASLLAVPAHAVVIERAIASNSVGYFVQDSGRASLSSVDDISGNQGQHFVFRNAAGQIEGRTEIGLEFTGYANEEDGGFFFLHNNFCVGMCAVGSSTRVTFDIFNDGAEAVDLRFDSMITPGHLALVGQNGFGEAGFDFTVRQDPNTASARLLYSATGVVDSSGPSVSTSDGRAFNGLTNVIRSDDWAVLDWGATNLNLGLGLLGAGQRTTVVYEATYYAGTYDACLDLTACSGVQVGVGAGLGAAATADVGPVGAS
ncbi:MAG: hypothetical protein M1823_006422 [Watsoniomyces obsoletus]|nr:MAG: hypothetical protein M1823_006422 [Watsoniomyces obsoletus]